MTEIERIARLEAQRIADREDIAEIKTDVKAIRSAVDQAKGGWKMLLAVGSAAGVIGAGLSQLIEWVKN